MLGEPNYCVNKHCLFEVNVRAPLVISGSALPKYLRGVRAHRAAERVDIFPSMLDAVGIEAWPEKPRIGLLSSRKRPVSFSELSDLPVTSR